MIAVDGSGAVPAGTYRPTAPSGTSDPERPSASRTTSGQKIVEPIQAEPRPSAARRTASAVSTAVGFSQ